MPASPAARAAESDARQALPDYDPMRRLVEVLPRPLRFLSVGGLGLVTDLAVFTIVIGHGLGPLTARLVSLAVATIVTWRLNRALTFDRSGRHQGDEAIRYAAVSATAQAVSYGVFAFCILAMPAALPQLALLLGAATGAAISYAGQLLFAFRPSTSISEPGQP